ncbi:hypothetical protein [Microbispora bryophytorum]|uniref:hypothetical protein n=1 Tax=Microbispora bryophytorum TaxID=1460882 RepID=UPI0033C56737
MAVEALRVDPQEDVNAVPGPLGYVQPAQKTVAVKILAPVQPVPPSPMADLPFTPVEFDGISVTPYVNQAGRLAYSIRVREMRAPRSSGGRAAAQAKDAA